MLLVTQGKGRINQLGFDKKTSEYVYFHKGKEIWREKGDKGLLDYFSDLRTTNSCISEEKLANNRIWNKYLESCAEFE